MVKRAGSRRTSALYFVREPAGKLDGDQAAGAAADHHCGPRMQSGQDACGVVHVVHQVQGGERRRGSAAVEAPAVIDDAPAMQGEVLGGIRPHHG